MSTVDITAQMWHLRRMITLNFYLYNKRVFVHSHQGVVQIGMTQPWNIASKHSLQLPFLFRNTGECFFYMDGTTKKSIGKGYKGVSSLLVSNNYRSFVMSSLAKHNLFQRGEVGQLLSCAGLVSACVACLYKKSLTLGSKRTYMHMHARKHTQ